jgi:hypothetical protein
VAGVSATSETLLQGSPKKAHQALEALLRGNRITVHQAPEGRDYRIEGVAELTLEAHTAGRPETTSRMLSVVAGEGFAGELRSPAQRSEASSRTPDLRVMRKFQRFPKIYKHRRVTDLRCLGIGSRWVPLVQSDLSVTPPPMGAVGTARVRAVDCYWAALVVGAAVE